MSVSDWIARRFGRRSATGASTEPVALVSLEAHKGPIYAVGDLHGCHQLYRKMEQRIVDHAAKAGTKPTLILMGDLVDRGPETAFLLDDLSGPERAGPRRLALRGNHEEMMLAFLRSPKANAAWLGFGGRETLASYGLYIEPDQVATLSERRLQQMFTAHIPDTHITYLTALPYGFVFGRFALAHAGLDPAFGLDEQPREALLMGRGRLGDLPADVTLVHGHYIVDAPVVAPQRISIDTGAYRTGMLTAVRLSRTEAPEILTVGAD